MEDRLFLRGGEPAVELGDGTRGEVGAREGADCELFGDGRGGGGCWCDWESLDGGVWRDGGEAYRSFLTSLGVFEVPF